MVKEEIVVRIDGERDRIEEISEDRNTVTVIYERSGQLRRIEVPRTIIDDVKKIIDAMLPQTEYKSLYVYNKYMKERWVKSNIITERLKIIEKEMEKHNISKLSIQEIFKDLQQNPKFVLMTFQELIGTRKIKESLYFKLYSAIRYWKEQGLIHYTQQGTIIKY